jgi:hypothetical protein
MQNIPENEQKKTPQGASSFFVVVMDKVPLGDDLVVERRVKKKGGKRKQGVTVVPKASNAVDGEVAIGGPKAAVVAAAGNTAMSGAQSSVGMEEGTVSTPKTTLLQSLMGAGTMSGEEGGEEVGGTF